MSWGFNAKGRKEAVKKAVSESKFYRTNDGSLEYQLENDQFTDAVQFALNALNRIPSDWVSAEGSGHTDALNSYAKVEVSRLFILE